MQVTSLTRCVHSSGGEKDELKLQHGAASSKHAPGNWALGQSLGTNACKETTFHFIIEISF